jgi:hypothetical protein
LHVSMDIWGANYDFSSYPKVKKNTNFIVMNDEYDYLKQTVNLLFCNLSTMNN